MSEARTDALTGLPNRRAFDEELARRMAEWRRYRRPLSILMVDVDHFKKFNDTVWSPDGRRSPAPGGRACCATRCANRISWSRYGGEEMAVVLPGTDIQEACRGAQRARQAIEAARFQVDGQDLERDRQPGNGRVPGNRHADRPGEASGRGAVCGQAGGPQSSVLARRVPLPARGGRGGPRRSSMSPRPRRADSSGPTQPARTSRHDPRRPVAAISLAQAL